MTVEERYRERYQSGKTPWDVGKPDFNLIETVTDHPVPRGKALDIGCGTGDNSIWLAQSGFEVVGTDVSEIALEQAGEKAARAGLKCEFIRIDFIRNKVAGYPFCFLFDRGCFHSFDLPEDRELFARNAADHLEEGGLWLTIAGSADERRPGPGPPRRTAAEIVLAVEPFFEILTLQDSVFGSNRSTPPRAWRCLMRKRPGVDSAGKD